MPAKQTVMLLFKLNQQERAQRIAVILDGSDLEETDGHLVTHVPIKNLEAALLFEETKAA